MKPCEVKFYIYAEDEKDVQELQNQLNDFVRDKYNIGVLVTATKLSSALKKFCNNIFVNNYLR
jgi:hypothetical protein